MAKNLYEKFAAAVLKRTGFRLPSGGTRKNWGKFSSALRQTAKNKAVAGKSRLSAESAEWQPEHHVLRLKSNANYTRNENKKMANAIYRNLNKVHRNRMRNLRGGTRKNKNQQLERLEQMWKTMPTEKNRPSRKNNKNQENMEKELFGKLKQFGNYRGRLLGVHKH